MTGELIVEAVSGRLVRGVIAIPVREGELRLEVVHALRLRQHP
jgi:hypothetical protein